MLFAAVERASTSIRSDEELQIIPSSHVSKRDIISLQVQQNKNHGVVTMSNDEITELTWENGQLAWHGLGGTIAPPNETNETWCTTTWNTLESLVHQASTLNKFVQHDEVKYSISTPSAQVIVEPNQEANLRSMDTSSGAKKRIRTESSASVIFSPNTMDKNMKSNLASFENPRSFKTARNTDEDSACDQDCLDQECTTKGGSFRSQSSTRRSHAATHNQSERRRRDRINEKMKALQKLVPNASKTDKASMLDEVIEYLKQLQAQVQIMSNSRNMPQMVMPNLAMQRQLQMSLLARMGMGMIDMNNLARNMAQPLGSTSPSFIQLPFIPPGLFSVPFVPRPPPPLKSNVHAKGTNSFVPNFSGDAYSTFLAQQSMNMDLFNKMVTLYRGQANQPAVEQPFGFPQPNNVQRE